MIACEFMVNELLPTIRKETARLLISKDYTQREISKILEVSEAAVSQYIKERRGKHKKRLEELISKYISEHYDINKSFAENVCDLCINFRKKGYFCKSHKIIEEVSSKFCMSCLVDKEVKK
ncbi:MAG: hypothetical protein NZ903_02800 [Candidatus Micrarchaeota archaeon]|nr:hypothetical protein [Candidatus Micrarchaeota archaeon]